MRRFWQSSRHIVVEWAVAAATGTAADAFLGTQGDPWDTQKDMLTALIGASTALVMLSGAHSRMLSRCGSGICLAERIANDHVLPSDQA